MLADKTDSNRDDPSDELLPRITRMGTYDGEESEIQIRVVRVIRGLWV